MKLALFEPQNWENFLPLVHTRALFELRLGALTIAERNQIFFQHSGLTLFCRDYLADIVSRRFSKATVNSISPADDETLFLSSGAVVDKKLADKIKKRLKSSPGREFCVFKNDEMICGYLKKSAGSLAEVLISRDFQKVQRFSVGERLDAADLVTVSYPWQLVALCETIITADLKAMISKRSARGRKTQRGVTIFGKDHFIDQRSSVEPNVVIRSDSGPVYIDRGAVIQSGARIEGPAYVGEDSVVVGGAQIRRGSVMGPNCRVGGEMDASIMHGFSNKYHFSFLSHSYVGEWVNVGAGFISSNLKNTYGTIKANVGERLIDTGMTKYGCLIADHAKTSVGAMTNSGRTVGVASHIAGFVTDDVPSFTFYSKSLNGKLIELDLDRVLTTQERMMRRRNIEQTKENIELMKNLYELTKNERMRPGVSKGPIRI